MFELTEGQRVEAVPLLVICELNTLPPISGLAIGGSPYEFCEPKVCCNLWKPREELQTIVPIEYKLGLETGLLLAGSRPLSAS